MQPRRLVSNLPKLSGNMPCVPLTLSCCFSRALPQLCSAPRQLQLFHVSQRAQQFTLLNNMLTTPPNRGDHLKHLIRQRCHGKLSVVSAAIVLPLACPLDLCFPALGKAINTIKAQSSVHRPELQAKLVSPGSS
jgi:hypothetical protein